MGSTDIQKVRGIFNRKDPPIPHANMAWFYNRRLDRWEVYDNGSDMEGGTLVAHLTADSGRGWVEV